jgi:hypothetical protein
MRLRDKLRAEPPAKWNVWLLCLLLSVLFTPSISIPGNIPVHLDDVLVFGAGAIFIAESFLWLEVPGIDQVFFCNLAVAGSILLSTMMVPDGLGLEVTAKDYLDVLRPVKFLLVYWLVRECHPETALRTFIRTISIAPFILLGIACIEMFFARMAPGSIVVGFFSLFTGKSPDLVVNMMATRPFATFNTPTDLGYAACVCLFAGSLIHCPRRRNAIIVTSFLILLITVTRTLLFSLPLLLILRALLGGKTINEAFKRLRFSLAIIILAGISSAVLLPLISPHASEFTQSMIASIVSGDTSDQESITTRLDNLNLVTYTWLNAPVLGVGSRSLLPDFVDSELILTFHRYGLLGLASLLLIYPLGFRVARQAAKENRELYLFAVMALAATLLIGITQGALTNSRTGVLLFVILGIIPASNNHELCKGKLLTPSIAGVTSA